MPPKQAGKGKVKSAKLSKAEKEKLKKEEAERKVREEEEARLKAEQEQREKEEKERVEREERERLQEQERARHQAEVDELSEILDSNSGKLRSLQEHETTNAKWDRYMLCDGCPDPLQDNELNTYVNLWREEVHYKPIPVVLEEIEDCLKLLRELEHFLILPKEEGITEDDVLRHKESNKKLQMLAKHKLDESTMHLLQNATEHLDTETQNVQYVTKSEHVHVCIWGNTAKNPRVKSFTFREPGFTMDIPKVLAVRNVAVELIYTSYDHLSPLAKSYYPKIKKKPAPDVVVNEANKEEILAENGEGGKDDEKAAEEEAKETLSPPKSSSATSRASRRKSGRARSSKSSRGHKASAKSEKSQNSESERAAQKEKEEDKSEEVKEESADQQGDTSGTSEHFEMDESEAELADEDFDEDDDDVVDLRAFSVVGPVMNIQLLELPPQPKLVGGWTIQQVVSSELKRVPYHSELQGSSDLVASEPGTPAPSTGSTPQLPTQQAYPPINITLKLPTNVMYFEQPQLARWEPSKNQWRMDELDEFQFNEEQRTFSFKTSGFGPLSTMQDLYLNMPFQSWELRPRTTNSCLFTVIAAIIELEIEIKDSLCCLSQPEDVRELDHLRGKWMKPQELITAMQKTGVNIFPAVDADKYVSINTKDETLESRIYQEMSLTASAFAYTWSKWNAECGKDKVVLQAVEQPQDEPLLEEDWSLFMIGTHSSCKLRMTEEDKELSDDVAESTQLHSDLYHMVRDGTSEEVLRRVQHSSFLFVDCVHQLLNATKVLTFS